MQAYRDYIGGHKLEFLPRLKRCQKYPPPTSMSTTSMTHVIWVIIGTWMTTMFVRSYNLACKAFLYLTSINSSSCLSKAKIIIGDLNPACWWVPVEQSITFVSKLRFFVTKSWQNCYKSGPRWFCHVTRVTKMWQKTVPLKPRKCHFHQMLTWFRIFQICDTPTSKLALQLTLNDK